MAILTGFTRVSDPINAEQLASSISTALGKTVGVEITPTEALVWGTNISESDRTAIQAAISAYSYVAPTAQAVHTHNEYSATNHTHQYADTSHTHDTAHNHDASYSATGHTHNYASTTHAHAAADTTSGTFGLAQIPTGSTASTVALGNHTHAAVNPTYATLANGTTAMALATNNAVKVTPTATATYTTTVPPAGSVRQIIILTSGVSSFTITFGSGFKPTATLATGTTTARVFVISFVSDGTNLYEASRTVAMVA